jgi:hypothetical protein
MAEGTARSALMLRLEACSERFDPVDDRWRRQVDELLTDLCIEVGPVVRDRATVRGMKGGVDSALLAVGSATTAGVIPLLTAWISRDRTRSLKVSWHADGRVHEVEIRGDDVDSMASETLPLLLRQLGQHD